VVDETIALKYYITNRVMAARESNDSFGSRRSRSFSRKRPLNGPAPKSPSGRVFRPSVVDCVSGARDCARVLAYLARLAFGAGFLWSACESPLHVPTVRVVRRQLLECETPHIRAAESMLMSGLRRS
jgi:hypothetical protein